MFLFHVQHGFFAPLLSLMSKTPRVVPYQSNRKTCHVTADHETRLQEKHYLRLLSTNKLIIMARATRASAKGASASPQKQSQEQSSPKAAGIKRKASTGASPQAKRGKKGQQTLEQTVGGADDEGQMRKNGQNDEIEDEKTEVVADQADVQMKENLTDADIKDAVDNIDAETEKKEGKQGIENGEQANGEAKANEAMDGDDNNDGKVAELRAQADKLEAEGKKPQNEGDVKTEETPKEAENHEDKSKEERTDAVLTDGSGAIEHSQKRGAAMPSNILEKGIIYFFTRGRVGMDDPKSVQDIARSYIVLRPLPQDAKLTDGPIDDLKNNRLLALPKKVLPRSHRDVFMTFVEKAGVSIDALKEEFLQGSTYDTATTGTRTSPAVTPIGEGVYAITTTGQASAETSHLAYMLTIPAEMGEVQEQMGLAAKGSFALSLKNPTQKGPSNANLDTSADFPQDIMDDFRGRGWMPVKPKHLDYEKAQLILIGEAHGDLGKAVQAEEKDEQNEKIETPNEEMEKLEGEDSQRVEALRGDDSVFDDLGISKKDYPAVMTTW